MAPGCSHIRPERASSTMKCPRSSAFLSHSYPKIALWSEYPQTGELWSNRIQTLGQLRQMAGGHGGEQMVLHMKEHVVGGAVLKQSPQRSSKGTRLIAVVVDGPNGEERREALSRHHRQDVIAKPGDWKGTGCYQQPASHHELGHHPAKICATGFLPRVYVQAHGE